MTQLPIRLSVSEAAKLFGVSQKTIRQALKSQELRYIIVKNRYKIHFDSLVSWSQKSTRRANQFYSQGIGQYADRWQIKNKKYSPSQQLLKNN